MLGRGRWGGPWSSSTPPSPKTAHLFPPLLPPLKHSFLNWDQIFAINDIAGCTLTSSWFSAADWLHQCDTQLLRWASDDLWDMHKNEL
ncbi:hypothetical protein OPV22_020945 [Ensete ventricosum]|uniref:Uncharacterized protein n=1 Tax=Ensete ventricosum TaxID=4639 RepID=A0AAV8QLD1_ENSVE|nr:hypothetical protein OPV22_020945 [Ensete ventricosum]